MISVDSMSLWNAVCSVLLCKSVRKRTLENCRGSFFSHRTHRSNRTLLRTVLILQNAFGIQNSQNVSAIIITNKGHNEAYILFIGVSRWLRPSLLGRGRGRGLLPIGVSRWSRPFPSGEGKGEGPLSLWTFVCSVHLCSSVRNRTHPLDEIRPMRLAGEVFLSTWGGFFSHRAHRVHWAFWRTFRAHRTPSAYREHRGLSTKISCKVLWNRLT